MKKVISLLLATLYLSVSSIASSSAYVIKNDGAARGTPYVHCPFRHTCIWSDSVFRGDLQITSGFSHYTDLNGGLHDRASSWVNANEYTTMWLGEWVNGRHDWNHLVWGSAVWAGYKETNLIHSGFNDRADFVVRADWNPCNNMGC